MVLDYTVIITILRTYVRDAVVLIIESSHTHVGLPALHVPDASSKLFLFFTVVSFPYYK